jgi:hypothetical protein
MDVVFKAINNKTYPYNVNLDDSIGSVVEKLFVDANINKETNNIKVIYQGKILSHEQKFSEFAPSNPKDKVAFVFMSGKNKPVVQQNQQVQSTQSAPSTTAQSTQPNTVTPSTPVTVVNQPIQINNNNNYEDEYEEGAIDDTDKLRAALVGMMVFIRANPQMTELFNNNFEALAQIIMSPQFKPMFDSMLNDMSAGDENLDNLADSVYDTHQNLSNSSIGGNQQSQTVSLTQEDLNNIGTLEALGFPKQACVQAYVLANKNLDMAASMLMDM